MKTVLITGGTRGIGKATAFVFASHGYQLALSYCTREDTAIKTKEEIEKEYGVNVMLVKADLSKEDEISKMVEDVYEKYPVLDCLVNNAGIAIDTLFEEKTKENFLKTLDVNLVGPFLLSRMVGDKMKDTGCGVIINVSSTSGLEMTYPESLDYDASKAGLISLTHNLANYYGKEIRVNAVAPGWVNTEMSQDLEKDFYKKQLSSILLERFAEPKEIGTAIYFLASEEASYINDTVLRVDGGVKR